MTGPAPAISVDRLVKRYDGRAVVDGASLAVEAGQVVALLGPNGAGKTTTVEIVEGYRRADGGTVRVLGEDPWDASRDLRARVGLMLQAGGFDIRARPRETLRQYAGFHAAPADPDALIELVGLGAVAGTPYRRLSGGERQRLALAVALVGRPEVLILDEPTAGMDPEARVATRSIIDGRRGDGAAILLTSHDLVDVERLADRIVIIVEGRMVASGSATELAAGLRPRLRFRLDRPLTTEELPAVTTAIGANVRMTDPGGYEVDGVAPSPALLATLTAWCAANDRMVVESTSVGGSLEDAYLALVEGAR
jgi:ABC-2 type transport system ATP-binding protein